MIWRTFIVCIILVIIYSIFIYFIPNISVYQHHWQENTIRAQKYIYEDDAPMKNVLVGSSLSQRLNMDTIPDIYNLAFSGLSSIDGLNVVKHKKELPNTIYIEMNMIMVNQSEDFDRTLFSPIPYYLKRFIPSLRDDKQPVVVADKALKKTIEQSLDVKLKSTITPNEQLRDKMLNDWIVKYSVVPDPQLLERQFRKLSHFIDYFRSKGVRIIFFELPLDPGLVDLPYSSTIRDKFRSTFPESEYYYVDFPRDYSFSTTDGVHLTFADAAYYTHYFKTKVSGFQH